MKPSHPTHPSGIHPCARATARAARLAAVVTLGLVLALSGVDPGRAFHQEVIGQAPVEDVGDPA